MKAIILGAGKATRLLPLTKEIAQSMLKIGEKSILEIQIENLKKAGIDDIILITGHSADKLEEFCKEREIKTLFNPFYKVSGMALTLWIAKEKLKGGFLFLYSDILFDSKIIIKLLENKNDICLAIKKNELREEAEKVVEEEGVIKIISKDKIDKENGEFIGIAKFSENGAEKIIEELKNTAKTNLNASFIEIIDELINKGEKVAACHIQDAQFIDIDFPEDLEKAKRIFGNKKIL